MIGQIRQIHHLHPHFFCLAVESRSVFGSGIIIVNRISIRHCQIAIQHSTHRFERTVDAVFDGSDDMQKFHRETTGYLIPFFAL